MDNGRLGRITVVGLLVVGALAGCASEDSGADGTASAPGTDGIPSSSAAATSPAASAPGDSVPSEPLTGAQICERLTKASVTADLGLEVTTIEPDDTSTPQCAYGYVSGSGATSNLTVAAMRPEDVGGATGADAFAFVVDLNRNIAGDDVEEQEIDAGTAAVRLTGDSLHLGVVQIGDHVYTLIVPVGDAEIDAVDRLISTMTTVLS
jgi:hypothetical protein